MPSRRKRARTTGDAEEDSLPSGKKARTSSTQLPTTSPATSSTGRRVSGARATKNADVSAEDGTSVYGPPESEGGGTASDIPTTRTLPSPTTRTARSVYDPPESDDELSTPLGAITESSNPSKNQRSVNSSKSKGRGKSAQTWLSKDELASDTTNDSTPLPRTSASKRRGTSSKALGNETPEATQQDLVPATANGSPAKRRRRCTKAAETETLGPANDERAPVAKPAIRPSIWDIRRAGTRGLAISAAMDASTPLASNQTEPQGWISSSTPYDRRRHADKEPAGDTPKLKGILTPSRRDGTPRTRKSVAFDSVGKKGQELYFEDLPSKPKGKKAVKSPEELPPTATAEVTEQGSGAEKDVGMQDAEDEETDEEVCSICRKPNSKRGNRIIFCDGCDVAVHQRCYDVPVIPKGDWFCRNCTRNDAVAVRKDEPTGGQLPAATDSEQAPDIPNSEQYLRAVQRLLIDRCTGRQAIPLQGQDEAYDKAFQLVEQTVLAGEGNSMLVIGVRGSGKTTLVESIVSKMAADHGDEFHVVRLNGFIHTNDKIALKEIWRQLGKEMAVEDDFINRTNNYADTLASLLAVLSHASEILDTQQQGVTSKSVIFIIDEFDLFATHARQTLLYNLFDIAQARKAPIAVLGLTTRIDVVESLEKRVKSRFSHRYVYLSLAKSLPAFWDICRRSLTIDVDELRGEDIDTTQKGFGEFLQWWNGRIEALYKDPGFQDHLEYHFHSTKSVCAFLTTCILPLAALSPTSLSLQPHFADPAARTVLDAPDSKLALLPSLSDLDLSMLIAAARLDIVAHTDTVNFAMVYDEYTSLMGRQRVQSASSGLLALGGGVRVWGRGVAGVSWERLVALGLLVPAGFAGRGGGGGAAATAGGGLEGKMWKVDVALEEIPACVKLSQVLSRWCREI